MEKHCTSLELSKRLKALGVKQESEFYWVESQINHKWVIERKEMVRLEIFGDSATSAFLASELGEMLPDYTRELGNLEIGKCDTDHVSMERQDKRWWNVSYWTWENAYTGRHKDLYLERKNSHLQQSETLPDALALMLEYLIQNKLLKI